MLLSNLPLAGIILLVVIGLVVRPIIQLLRYGRSGVLLFRGNGPQKVRDGLLVLLLTGFIVHALVALRGHALASLLMAAHGALHAFLQIIGAGLIVVGTVLFAAAQINLGPAWRIGIDPESAPGIVRGGLYAVSRHPIYLGFLTVFAGYAAMLPTPLSLALLVGGYLLLRAQADAEEAHMLRTYGEAYRAYADQVGRFVPGIGRGTRAA